MKYLSIDIETTGVDRKHCDIIEFGAILDDLSNQIALSELPRFHTYILPPVGQNYSGEPFALSMHRDIFLRIANREAPYTYTSPMKLGFAFKTFLVKHGFVPEKDRVTINVAGKNFGSFDYPYLEEKSDLFKHVNIRSRLIDPAIFFLEEGDESLPGTGKCKERMQKQSDLYPVSDNVAHTSLEDALDVVRLVRVGFDKFGLLGCGKKSKPKPKKAVGPQSLKMSCACGMCHSIGREATEAELDAAMDHGLKHM